MLEDTNIKLPIEVNGISHVYHLYTILVEQRDELREYLLKNGIEARIAYGNHYHCCQPIHTVTLKNLTLRMLSSYQKIAYHFLCVHFLKMTNRLCHPVCKRFCIAVNAYPSVYSYGYL